MAAGAVALIALVAAVVLTVRSTVGDSGNARHAGDPAASTGRSESRRPATAPPAPLPATVDCATLPAQDVVSAGELTAALAGAGPGTAIRLADGVYPGNFTASAQGTPEQPIVLCGGRGAILDGGAKDNGYTLHLAGAEHWKVVGFTVRGGQKGVMADRAVGNLIEGLAVLRIGDEAIHLRAFSTDNLVRANTIRGTGLRRDKYGEGIYVGSAESNWCAISECKPDRSDRNIIEGNDIAETTAESVDIKEGTTGGILRGNIFSGADMTDSDSWVDVKGNGWTITSNTGTQAPEDGFQTHTILDGWGVDNVFAGNTARVNADGYAINITGTKDERADNEVACDNVATAAGEGVTNVDCTS
jgi:hypothetical protein